MSGHDDLQLGDLLPTTRREAGWLLLTIALIACLASLPGWATA